MLLTLSAPLALWTLTVACPRASADVGVVLNESLDENVDRISSTGHSAIYFSNICAESPIKLRLCQSGELGSILSNYLNIGEDQSFEWNIVPLSIYLYGVEDPRNRTLFSSYAVKHLLEERYRDRYLTGLCASESCRSSAKAEWREMVAATMIRGVYIFSVHTTIEQDLEIIAQWNDAANKNHFNGVTNNCADFTKRVINTYFPHAVKTDHLNDFGMTSPKAVARTFTRYAQKHADSELRVMHFAQQPGTTKRSRTVRSGTEQLFHSGKLLLPMVLVSYYALPVVTTSYFTTARFNAQKEFEHHAAALDSDDSTELSPVQIAGTPQQWKDSRGKFAALLSEDRRRVHRSDVAHFFRHLDQTGTPSLSENGSVWITVSANGESQKLGISTSNLLARPSDSGLAREFMLARIDQVLSSPARTRETFLEFQQDWAALQQASGMRPPKNPPQTVAGVQSRSARSTGSASLAQ